MRVFGVYRCVNRDLRMRSFACCDPSGGHVERRKNNPIRLCLFYHDGAHLRVQQQCYRVEVVVVKTSYGARKFSKRAREVLFLIFWRCGPDARVYVRVRVCVCVCVTVSSGLESMLKAGTASFAFYTTLRAHCPLGVCQQWIHWCVGVGVLACSCVGVFPLSNP